MKFVFAVLCLSLCSSAFAGPTQLKRAPASQPKCPPVVETPTKLICDAKFSYVGAKFSHKFEIPLKEESYKVWTGSVEFQYPGISNNNSPNTIQARVFSETHGNNETCPVQQTFELQLNVLDYKFSGARKTSYSLDDGFGFATFDAKVDCAAK